MELLDSLTITHNGDERSIELWLGDLTLMPPSEAVDILVVSAFPNDYSPVRGTLIGGLFEKGINVERLSQDKLEDRRQACSCWLSKEIGSTDPGIKFKHILCFEPATLGTPADVVSDIFRSLNPFIIGDLKITQVAMPLVSTGNVGESLNNMMDALFEAATKWMESGLPLKRLKIVERSPMKAAEMKGAFGILKKQYREKVAPFQKMPKYDIFLSYSRKIEADADVVIQDLRSLKPDINIFVDREGLKPGMAWQDELFQSIDNSKKVLVLFSPEYIDSKACQEEFNFASLMHTRLGGRTLFPLLVYETPLLRHMSKYHYENCLVADREKMRKACEKLIKDLAEK